jgi:N-acetyl-anhydromuramyl-L-alanine amidase AmpD
LTNKKQQNNNQVLVSETTAGQENEKVPVNSVPIDKTPADVGFNFTKPKRTVTKIFLHCSDNSNPKWGIPELQILHNQNTNGDGIQYHYFIDRAGKIHNTRELERHPIMAQENNNTNSIAICVHGGQHGNDFKDIQMKQLQSLCKAINEAYNGIPFRGHCEVSKKGKACPVFDYKSVLKLNGKGYINR